MVAPLVRATYAVAAMLIIIPLTELGASLASFQPGELLWRFGAMGQMSSALLTPVLGVFLSIVAAHLLEHHWVRRIVAVLAGVVALALLVGMGLFVLDALQIRSDVTPQMLRNFTVATARALISQAVAVIVLIAISVSAFGGFRQVEAKQQSRSSGRAGALLVNGVS